MKANSEFTIVYVFGPEQCEAKYKLGNMLAYDANEWVKIGETSFNYEGNVEDITVERMKDVAMKRIKNEPRTGIPFKSRIFDVFIFPYRVNTDLNIRKRLCNELYNIENSDDLNKNSSDNYSINAGKEFVYNIERSKIKYAIQSVDHDLIAEAKTDEERLIIAQCCKQNNIDLNNASDEDNVDEKGKRRPNLNLDDIFQEDEDNEVILKNKAGEDVLDDLGMTITAKYIGGNKFECRGEVMRSSPLALKYLNEFANMKLKTVNGNEHWYYKGKSLTSYRKN